MVGSCEHGNKLLDSTKCREFLYYLSECQLLKELITNSYEKISDRNISNIPQLLMFAICGFSTAEFMAYKAKEQFLNI